jgi:hypothetical protein
MIVEHLLEPKLLIEIAKKPRNCKDFLREFTKPSPRVLVNFPKFKKLNKLTKRLSENGLSDMHLTRLDELLNSLKEKEKIAFPMNFDELKPVQQNFKDAESVNFKGFHLLLNKENPFDLARPIIDINDIEASIESLESQLNVPKMAKDIADALSSLVANSKQITIVESYLDYRPGMWQTFLAILERCAASPLSSQKSITLLFSSQVNRKNAKSCKYLAEKLQQERGDLATAFNSITFNDIEENGTEAMHNRFVLTELAGVFYGYGLEQTNERESDDFQLMNENIYEKRFKQYVELQDFSIVESFSI